MVYSPSQRLTAIEALAHPYYDELREEGNYTRITKLTGVSHFFEFSDGSSLLMQRS
jgi:hypothetical protein